MGGDRKDIPFPQPQFVLFGIAFLCHFLQAVNTILFRIGSAVVEQFFLFGIPVEVIQFTKFLPIFVGHIVVFDARANP